MLKKILKSSFGEIAVYLLALSGILALYSYILPELAVAQSIHLPKPSTLGDNVAVPRGSDPITQIKSVAEGLVRNFKFVFGPVAIGFLVYAGIMMVTGDGDETVYTTQTRNIVYIIIGMVILAGGGFIAELADLSGGGLIRDKSVIISKVQFFDQKVQIIITFIKYSLGAGGTAMMIISGYKLITAGDEESLGTEKKRIGASAFALIIILFSNTLINKVVWVVDKNKIPRAGVNATFDLEAGSREIAGIVNFLLLFVGPILILSAMIAAIMYVTAGDNEERQTNARKAIIACVIGMLIIYGAFAVITTFVTGSLNV